MSPPDPAVSPFPNPQQVRDLLRQVLETSPADFTELAWLGRTSWRATTSAKVEAIEDPRQVVLLRVVERGRVGLQRLGGVDIADLRMAVRQALAHARAEPVTSPHLPKTSDAERAAQALGTDELYDHGLAELVPAGVPGLLASYLRRRQAAALDWTHGSLVVVNSGGLERRVDATCATLRVVCGRGPHAGLAAASGRTLDDLDPASVVERAQEREAEGTVEQPVPPTAPLVLAPEVVTVLLSQLNHCALTASSFLEGSSPLVNKLGEACFDSSLHLWDDGMDQDGLPFPCDLRGHGKRPLEIVVDGVLRTPAVNDVLAARLGDKAGTSSEVTWATTPHAVDGDEARFCHLFLGGGERLEDELVQDLEDGYYISSLSRVEFFPHESRLPFRVRLCGVRHIRDGHFAEALPELVWEDDLLRVLQKVEAVAREPVSLAWGDGFLGGVTAPALVVVAQGLRAS